MNRSYQRLVNLSKVDCKYSAGSICRDSDFHLRIRKTGKPRCDLSPIQSDFRWRPQLQNRPNFLSALSARESQESISETVPIECLCWYRIWLCCRAVFELFPKRLQRYPSMYRRTHCRQLILRLWWNLAELSWLFLSFTKLTIQLSGRRVGQTTGTIYPPIWQPAQKLSTCRLPLIYHFSKIAFFNIFRFHLVLPIIRWFWWFRYCTSFIERLVCKQDDYRERNFTLPELWSVSVVFQSVAAP